MNVRNQRGTPPIRATYNSFRLLETLHEFDGAGVTELADALEMSKSTVHEHLTTLRDMGYVSVDEGEYALSPTLLTFGGRARQNEAVYEYGQDEVDELARESGERVKLVVEEFGKGVYLYQSHGSEAVRTDTHEGKVVHLHATSAGKALLAHLPHERVEEIIQTHGLPARTNRTITDEGDLFDALEEIRQRGIAFDNEERIEGIRCVAAPILADGELLGALSVSGPTRRLTDDIFREEIPELVRETARVIEINATYSTHSG